MVVPNGSCIEKTRYFPTRRGILLWLNDQISFQIYMSYMYFTVPISMSPYSTAVVLNHLKNAS